MTNQPAVRQHKVLDHPILGYFLLIFFGLIFMNIGNVIDKVLFLFIPEYATDAMIASGIGTANGAIGAALVYKVYSAKNSRCSLVQRDVSRVCSYFFPSSSSTAQAQNSA